MLKQPPKLSDKIDPRHHEHIQAMLYSLSVNARRNILSTEQIRERIIHIINFCVDAIKE